MSIVADQVRRVDSQLDRLQLVAVGHTVSSPLVTAIDGAPIENEDRNVPSLTPLVNELQSIIKALSTTSSSNPLLASWRTSMLLDRADALLGDGSIQAEAKTAYEKELEWVLVSKATIQTYGLILNTLLEETIPLSNDIFYWDEVLGSYAYTGLYTIQTSPLRFWAWAKDIYQDSKQRFALLREAPEDAISARRIGESITERWSQFYSLVRESIRDRSVIDIQRKVLSPIALCRSEGRQKQAGLKRLREMSASALGVLMDEGLTFDVDEDVNGQAKTKSGDNHEWKVVVERSVALMDTVLKNVTTLETGVPEFEDTVFASVEDDPEISFRQTEDAHERRPALISKRLRQILQNNIPDHTATSRQLASEYGRPSRLVRYWLPAGVLLLSSTTVLRVVVNRKEAIVTWIRELGATVQDFWMNWVVQPTVKMIRTIRHDGDSQFAIMSAESLKGDRDSLERMVVDFAIEKPEAANVGTSPLSEAQIAEIRAKVKEGDVTPVLRAYEKDLRSPFMGAVRGDLVRTLLIQVQKTKVDVEVAMNGIDALLKSQELVFGFIGLTPGVLVSIGVFRYLGGLLGNKRGLRQGQKAGQAIRILRNIDRILTMSKPSSGGMLSYKDHGLLLCEVHLLRLRATKLFPGEVQRDFLEDVNELADISTGIARQRKVNQRIRWAYKKWLSG